MAASKGNAQNALIKEWIYEALMILMEKQDFHDITITDITNKAGVSRMAYYRNYQSKESIILSHVDGMFEEFSKETSSYAQGDTYLYARSFFSNFRNHARLVKNISRSGLVFLFLERLDNYISLLYERMIFPEKCEKIRKYQIDYMAGGLCLVLMRWIEQGMAESDEEMAEIVVKFTNGLQNRTRIALP